jgi:glycosyltransferase involved in cell wall biosynthesis
MEAIGSRAKKAFTASGHRKRVLICTNAFPPNFIGGAELIAYAQAQAMRSRGAEVVVFAGDPDMARARYSMREEHYNGLRTIRVVLHPKDYSAEFISFSHQPVEDHFAKVAGEFSPDVVHFHNVIGLSVGLIHTARRKNIPTVLTVHDHWGFCFRNTLTRRNGDFCQDTSECAKCMALVGDGGGRQIPIRLRNDFVWLQFRQVDVLISPSRYLAQTYQAAGIGHDRFRVIPNGISVGKFDAHRRDPGRGVLRLSFIGYLGSHKGVHLLIDAMTSIPAVVPVQLDIFGEGDQRFVMEERIRMLGQGDRILLRGKISNEDIPHVLQQTDVLLLPSVWPENQPVSITEAMASRIPVIASRVGGVPELVRDGVTGYLFDVGNARQLADRILEFVRQPDLAKEFGEHAYETIRELTIDNQVRKIESAYDELHHRQSHDSDPILVACIGQTFDPGCAGVIEELAPEFRGHLRFVMEEWLQDTELSRVSLIWVVDAEATLGKIARSLVYHLPLLVPEQNSEMLDLCRTYECGLYYDNAEEARECLLELIGDAGLCSRLRKNTVSALY